MKSFSDGIHFLLFKQSETNALIQMMKQKTQIFLCCDSEHMCLSSIYFIVDFTLTKNIIKTTIICYFP